MIKYASFRGRLFFCSNMYPCNIDYKGIVYPSAENAYQAYKSTDVKIHENFALLLPMEAKKAGQNLLIRSDWDKIKLSVMKEILKMKFSNADLAKMLLATGDEVLIEVNYWGDRFWGESPRGIGLNHLGNLLMEIRSELNASTITG